LPTSEAASTRTLCGWLNTARAAEPLLPLHLPDTGKSSGHAYWIDIPSFSGKAEFARCVGGHIPSPLSQDGKVSRSGLYRPRSYRYRDFRNDRSKSIPSMHPNDEECSISSENLKY
jgi:hypothetical protein